MESLLSADAERLHLVSRRAGRVGYLGLRGSLERITAPHLRASAARLIAAGCRVLVLDLSRITFVDSEGIRALLALREALGERQVPLRLVLPAGHPVDRTLRLLKFEGLFALYGTLRAAWRAPFPSRDGELRAA